MSSLLEKAIQIAVAAHSGAKRKNGTPYVLHPLRMMCRLQHESEQIVAVLHDVIEDTHWTLDDLKREGFPDHILAALDCVTKRAGETYEAFIDRAASNPLARSVKLADLEDNMNVAELPTVTPQDSARMAKYRKAWHRLTDQTGVRQATHFQSILPGNRLDWASAIGLFLTNFAFLDYLLFSYLESKVSAEELVQLKRRHFKDRIQRVRDIAATSSYTAENKQVLEDFFKRLEPIREIRNHIAHGQMLLRLADDTRTITFGVSLPQDLDAGGKPETRHLTLPELQASSRELVALIESFKPFAGFE